MPETDPIRTLGRYELLRRIAKGGMGEIYLARARGTAGFEKSCIIKTILGHLAEEDEFVTKFLDEGRIVVQLVHGNIVPVFDMGEENGEYYIAMEYIPGRDLREVTKRLGVRAETMPMDLALFVTSEVCKGLDYAHRKTDESGESLGIVHRDVSPSNVLISREGEVKIIDFGIARAAGRLGKTVSGRIQGKFCYMSPEQAGGKPLDSRSDIFSAGVVLYELLTGFRPFEGDSDLQSLDLVRQCEYDPPSTLNAEVPPEIDEILARALAKDADDRYQTIDRLQVDILQYLYTTGTSPTPSAVARFLAEVFPEGLEREDLRSARDSGPARPKKMSLDDALDFELGKLADDPGSGVDPHETTAVSESELGVLAAASKETRTHAQLQAGPDFTPETVEPPILGANPSASLPRESEQTSEQEDGGRRWGAIVVVAILLLAGAAGVFSMIAPARGKVEVVSDPPGAKLLVDGAVVLGAKTPHTLRLNEGEHRIRLELDGYEDRTISVNVVDGGSHKVTGRDARLQPLEPPTTPRMFRITATPAAAELSVDNAQFGTGNGANLVVEPGEVARVTATHPGCRDRLTQIAYGHSSEDVHIELTCPTVDADVGADAGEPQDEPGSKPNARLLRFQIRSEPKGATIQVNGTSLGSSPVTWTGERAAVLDIEASHPGYQTLARTLRAADQRGSVQLTLEKRAQGCLSMRLMNPYVANVSIGGRDLGRVSSKLERYELTAGSHPLRVQNEQVGLDHTRTVQVEAGDDCVHVVVDGSRL